jgi:hypothetical protein
VVVIGLAAPVVAALTPPLDPPAGQARELLLRELSKPEYQTSKSNFFQQLATWIADWFMSLHFGGGGGFPAIGYLIIAIVVAVALVVAFLVFGLPRLNRRSALTGALFGDEDARSSDALRAAAEGAAANGDYTAAIAEEFRAIARGLAERSVIGMFPGTTATEFAREAGRAFTASADGLERAARSFDGVRYLGRRGTEAEWRAVAALEREIRASKPLLAGARA